MSLGQSQATGIPNSVQARMRDIEKYSMGDLLVRALIGRDLIRWSDFVRALHDGTECPKQTIVSWVAFMDEHLPFLTALGIIDPRALDDTLQECGAHSLLRRQTYNVGTDPRQYEGTKDGEHLRLMRNHDLVVSLINGHGRLEIPDKKNLRDFLAKWVPLKRDRGRLYQLINLSDYDGSRDYSPTVFGDQVAELGFTRTQAKHRRLAYHLRQDLGMSLEEFLGLAATTPPRDESDDDIAGDFTGNDEPNHPELTEEVTRIPQTRQLEESLDEAGVERRTTPVVSQPARSPDPPLVELEDLGTRESESEDFDDESDEEEVEEPAAEADEAPPEKSEEVPVEEPIIAFDVPVGDSRDMQEFFGEEGADLLGSVPDVPFIAEVPEAEVPAPEPEEAVIERPAEEPAEAADPEAETLLSKPETDGRQRIGRKVHNALARCLEILIADYQWPHQEWLLAPLVQAVVVEVSQRDGRYVSGLLQRMKRQGLLSTLSYDRGLRCAWKIIGPAAPDDAVLSVEACHLLIAQCSEIMEVEYMSKCVTQSLMRAAKKPVRGSEKIQDAEPPVPGLGRRSRPQQRSARSAAKKALVRKRDIKALITQQEAVIAQCDKAMEGLQKAQSAATAQLSVLQDFLKRFEE